MVRYFMRKTLGVTILGRNYRLHKHSPFLEFFAVVHELVKQMVNDVGCEDSDSDAVGHFLRFSLDFDVEGEDDGPLGVTLQHRRRLHDVTLVHGTDADTLVRDKRRDKVHHDSIL